MIKFIIIISLCLFCSSCVTSLYPDGFFTELVSGKHWDCEAIKHGKIDFNIMPIEDALDAVDYCLNDRMYQYNICGRYPFLHFDWKTGSCQ